MAPHERVTQATTSRRRSCTLRRRGRTRYQTFDVAPNAVSRRNERVGVTGSMDLRHIGLCEALIFSDKLRRERHVNDTALAHMVFERRRRLSFGAPAGVDDGGCDIIEARRPARTDIENARAVPVVEKIEVD